MERGVRFGCPPRAARARASRASSSSGGITIWPDALADVRRLLPPKMGCHPPPPPFLKDSQLATIDPSNMTEGAMVVLMEKMRS